MGDPPGLSDEQRRALDRLSLLPVLGAYYLAHRWEAVKAFFVREAPKLVSTLAR